MIDLSHLDAQLKALFDSYELYDIVHQLDLIVSRKAIAEQIG
jgi:hypothetical protein